MKSGDMRLRETKSHQYKLLLALNIPIEANPVAGTVHPDL